MRARPAGHRDQERHQGGLARPCRAGDQGVADVADLPVEAIGGAGEGAEDRNRRPRPVPALLARRPVVERREGNEVRRLDKPRPRPPEPAAGQHRQVCGLQGVRHPGRHQPARREVAPGGIADLGDRAGAVGKGDQHQAMVAQHPLARHQFVGRLGQCLGLAQRLVACRQHLVLLASDRPHPGGVGQEAVGLHQGAAVWRHGQPVEHPGPGGRWVFLEGVHRGIGRIAGPMDLEVPAPEPQGFGEHRMAHAPGRGADLRARCRSSQRRWPRRSRRRSPVRAAHSPSGAGRMRQAAPVRDRKSR